MKVLPAERFSQEELIISLCTCTDKKENQKFLIDKEIQSGAVAKSYMTRLTASSYMGKFLHISSYCIRKPFLIYDFATAPL
jgi:hypothetical protein